MSTLESVLGENHPSLAEAFETMAAVCHRVGNTVEAARMEERAEKIRATKQVAYWSITKITGREGYALHEIISKSKAAPVEGDSLVK
jgi:hypothetical protein